LYLSVHFVDVPCHTPRCWRVSDAGNVPGHRAARVAVFQIGITVGVSRAWPPGIRMGDDTASLGDFRS
jgi:hypothetical protein